MLTAQHEQGMEPDLLVDTSVGAGNAAHLASPRQGATSPGAHTVSTAERLDSVTRLWHGIRRQHVFALDPRRWLEAARGTQSSMFPGAGLERLIERHLG